VTSPTKAGIGAWLLKCNPNRWDLPRFIRDGHRKIDSWTINLPSPRLAVGQPVLFWVTGPAKATPTPGLWGAGVITGQDLPVHSCEEHYWLNPPSDPRSSRWIAVDIGLFDSPIPRPVLAEDPRLHDLQILRAPVAGNPQPVTARHLEVIERYLTPSYTATYGPAAHARAIVINEYRRQGWSVERAPDAGWDLTCEHRSQVLRIAVRSGDQITIGRAEVTAANDPRWRLVVVNDGVLTEFDGADALKRAQPITYEIRLR